MAGAPPPPERSPRHDDIRAIIIPSNGIAHERHASPAKCTSNKRAAAALAGPTRAKRPRDGRGQASSISSGEVQRLQPHHSRESAGNPARESTAGTALGLTAELWRLREKSQEEHLLSLDWPGLQRHVLPSREQWVPCQHRRPPRSSSAAFEPAATPAAHAQPGGIFRRPPPRPPHQHPPPSESSESSELRDGLPLLSDAMRRAAEEGARLLYAARNRRHRAQQQPGEAPAQWAFEAALGSSSGSGLGNQS